jgi:hypothetical protein
MRKPPGCRVSSAQGVRGAGIAVFKIAFERWISETSQRDLPRLVRESLDELKAVIAGK